MAKVLLFTIIDGAANAVAVQVAKTAAAVIPVMKSFFIKNITMVPLRAVSEALQATVSWDAATETVTIQSAAQGSYPYAAKTYTENHPFVVGDGKTFLYSSRVRFFCC